MTFGRTVEDIIQVAEGAGVVILVAGGLLAFVHSAVLCLIPARRHSAYHFARRHLGRAILLGLEVLIVADIIRTVVVDPTVSSVAVLATIVTIRIALSWSLSVEINGVWPWRKYQDRGGGDEGLDGDATTR